MAVTAQCFKERQTAQQTCKSDRVCEAGTQSNCAREEKGPQSAGGGEGEQERVQARRGRRETKLGAWLRGRDAGKGMKTGQPKTAW